MKIKQTSYIIFFMVFFLLMVSPTQTFADGKYPVRITNQSMVVFPVDETTIQVVQSMNFENSGSEKEEQLPIYLPENYADLQLNAGLTEENGKETEKGITDITGLDGGESKQIVITYKMPMFDGSSQWEIEQSYVTEQIQVVIQPGVLSFIANGLVTQSDLFEMNGQEFRRFVRMDAHPDKPWPLSFRLLSTANQNNTEEAIPTTEEGASYTEDGIKIIGGGGFGFGKAIFTIVIIIVAFTAALIGLKRDLLKSTGRHRKVKRSWLVEEKKTLLSEIVQLEKDYRDKLITVGTYEKNKQSIRDHIVRITMELDEEPQG